MKLFRILVMGIILVMLLPGITWSYQEKGVLETALISSGARLEVFDVVDWSVINREFMAFPEMEKYNDNVIKLFGGKAQNFKIMKDSDEMYRILNTEGWIDSDTFLNVIVQSVKLPQEYEKEPQTYLVVTVTSRDIEKLKELQAKVRDSIIASGGQSRITTCITGTFDGKLNEAEQDEMLDELARNLKIENFEQMRDDYTVSVVGFSPKLSDSISILGSSYNVNIAMRYNSEDDRTYIWIGTPVISVEY